MEIIKFPIIEKYVVEKYIRQRLDVIVNERLNKEIILKANKILKLVEKGYKNIVFPDILSIKRILLKEIKNYNKNTTKNNKFLL